MGSYSKLTATVGGYSAWINDKMLALGVFWEKRNGLIYAWTLWMVSIRILSPVLSSHTTSSTSSRIDFILAIKFPFHYFTMSLYLHVDYILIAYPESIKYLVYSNSIKNK